MLSNMRCVTSVMATVAVVASMAAATVVQAAPVIETARFTASDTFEWTGANVGSNPFNHVSVGATNTVSVVNPAGNNTIYQQGAGWDGNFAAGDDLLFTNFNFGPLDITFATAVRAAGAQIQRNTYGAFTATLDVFDTSNTLIGSFSQAGNSDAAGDNSAIFLGVSDSVASIKRIVYSVDTVGADFAINDLDINQVPVPAPIALLGGAIVALGVMRRKR